MLSRTRSPDNNPDSIEIGGTGEPCSSWEPFIISQPIQTFRKERKSTQHIFESQYNMKSIYMYSLKNTYIDGNVYLLFNKIKANSSTVAVSSTLPLRGMSLRLAPYPPLVYLCARLIIMHGRDQSKSRSWSWGQLQGWRRLIGSQDGLVNSLSRR